MLRNVMLYFAQDTRRILLENLYRLTASDGVLILGVGEQATESSRWVPVIAGGTSYYKPVAKGGKQGSGIRKTLQENSAAGVPHPCSLV